MQNSCFEKDEQVFFKKLSQLFQQYSTRFPQGWRNCALAEWSERKNNSTFITNFRLNLILSWEQK